MITSLFEFGLQDEQVAATLQLFPQGAAAKFIARGDLVGEIGRCRMHWQSGCSVRASTRSNTATQSDWPELNGIALHGITGDIARLATENSEADPIAVAMTHLVWSGAMFGRTRFIQVGDTQHHARLFSVIVGESSRARKGTSVGGPKTLWEKAEEHLKNGSLGRLPSPFCGSPLQISQGPMSTGEGVVSFIRDGSDNGEEHSTQGVPDKRLLIIEGEFGGVLKVAQRQGNTLTAIIRSAWDGSDLSPITKSNRIRATAPHLCVLGHITKQELEELLTTTDVYNGFANRIIWMVARRSKSVPNPLPIGDADVQRVGLELARLTLHAHQVGSRGGQVIKSNHAAEFWAHIYPELTLDHPGRFGVITARAEAQVLRIALTNALLDGKDMIGEEHLQSAVALWRYSADSVRLIFRDENADEQKVLNALADGPTSRTEISQLFGRHRSKLYLDQLLNRMQAAGKIQSQSRSTTSGRPATIWARTGRP